MSRDIALVIPTYNRYDTFLENNLKYYIQIPYFKEIIIYDDCSEDFDKILKNFKNYKKIFHYFTSTFYFTYFIYYQP